MSSCTPSEVAIRVEPAAQRRDRTLDAWRGLSVLAVILCHIVTERYERHFDGTDDRVLSPSAHGLEALVQRLKPTLYSLSTGAGTLAVQFFFVISGYVITTLLLREHARTERISLAAFYTRRGFRILPPALFLIGTALGLASLGYIAVPPQSFWLAATFSCNTSTACGWFLGHLWSLSVEEQFYVVWPCLVVLVGPRAVPQTAALLMAGFLMLSQLRVFDFGRVDNGMSFACIAAGCLYAASPRLGASITRAASPALIALAAALLVFRPIMPTLFRGSQRVQDLFTPALICYVLFSSLRYRDRLEKLVAVRLLARLGLISYGLYLWQQLFLAAPDKYLRVSFLNYPALCLPIVVLSYWLLERPLIQLGARLSKHLIDIDV